MTSFSCSYHFFFLFFFFLAPPVEAVAAAPLDPSSASSPTSSPSSCKHFRREEKGMGGREGMGRGEEGEKAGARKRE